MVFTLLGKPAVAPGTHTRKPPVMRPMRVLVAEGVDWF